MSALLSVDTVFFTVLGYPMSYLEFVGTVTYLWSVWLISRRHMLTWPIGIVSVLLFMVLFYQIRLYSDALEQIYYLGMSAYGWWLWSRAPREARVVTEVGFSAWRSMALTLSATIVLSLGLGHGMTRVHLHWPALFPEPASLPYLDATTTTMSFTAMWLMARRRTESWVYWIVVDVLGIGIYYVKDVRFVALLYLVLLGLATRGLLGWVSSESDR